MSEETKQHIKNIREKVLHAIIADNVTMHSRYYFLARTTLWVLGSILAFGTALFLISFIAFVFKGNALYLLPNLGPHGWLTLFISLPWIILLLVFAVFVILQVLSTHFSFVYKRPLVHTILGSIFILIVGGLAIAQTNLHERAFELSQGNKLPIAGDFYRKALVDQDNLHVGVVHLLEDASQFVLESRDGGLYTVLLSENTRMPSTTVLMEDAFIVVMGESEDDKISAIGIRPFDIGRAAFPPPRKSMPRHDFEREQLLMP